MNPPSALSLRTTIAQVIQALELAQIARLHQQEISQKDYRAFEAALQTRQQNENQALAGQEDLARVEQERLGELVGILAEIERAAQNVLKTAGLAHLTAAPAPQTVPPAAIEPGTLAAALASVPSAQVELHATLLRLAQIYLTLGAFERARQVLAAVSPASGMLLRREAQQLLYQSYFSAAVVEAEKKSWTSALDNLEQALNIQPTGAESLKLLADLCQRLASQALQAGELSKAESYANLWRRYSPQADPLLRKVRHEQCEKLCRQAQTCLDGRKFTQAGDFINRALALESDHPVARKLSERLRRIRQRQEVFKDRTGGRIPIMCLIIFVLGLLLVVFYSGGELSILGLGIVLMVIFGGYLIILALVFLEQ